MHVHHNYDRELNLGESEVGFNNIESMFGG